MSSILEIESKLKEEIGSFIIQFSEVEFSLSILVNLIYKISGESKPLSKIQLISFSKKREKISEYLESTSLQERWTIIDKKLSLINQDRRFLVHGHLNYSLPVSGKIETYKSDKGNITSRTYSSDSIRNLTKQLIDIHTGDDGLAGVFYLDFKSLPKK
jgi:hypothetical protein